MSHNHDFYATFQIKTKEDVDNLARGSGKYIEISNVLSRVMLLNTAFGVEGRFPDRKGQPNKIDPDIYAKVGEGDYASGLKALIHSNGNFNDYIACKLSELRLLSIDSPIDISALPQGSWLIEFPITLKKPFISNDDAPLYIIENPVRKDKVFGVPFTSAMAWKGNLRWAMMKIHLEPKVNSPYEFAEIRYQHTLLFGTEKGIEDTVKGWTNYLDQLCRNATDIYRKKLKERFNCKEVTSLTGMLHFYPTFWNRIGMEVINPHDRKTKTGKNPIYFELVPAGAKGFFRLLYVPFYYLSNTESELEKQVLNDLESVILGLEKLMLDYGFSAKRSSGYGVIDDKWDKEASRLIVNGMPDVVKFINFDNLGSEVKKLRRQW
ncbi:MAG: CRISPR-associated protein [Candidatus Saccharicenans sp.]|nr:CRISPR-associated protein [Candidatus Saccharicenans sp.]